MHVKYLDYSHGKHSNGVRYSYGTIAIPAGSGSVLLPILPCNPMEVSKYFSKLKLLRSSCVVLRANHGTACVLYPVSTQLPWTSASGSPCSAQAS